MKSAEKVAETTDLNPIKREYYLCPICRSRFDFQVEAEHCAKMHSLNTLEVKYSEFHPGYKFPKQVWLIDDDGTMSCYEPKRL